MPISTVRQGDLPPDAEERRVDAGVSRGEGCAELAESCEAGLTASPPGLAALAAT